MYIAIRHLQPFLGASVQVLRLWGTPTADQDDINFYEIVADQCKQSVNGNPILEIDGYENGAGNTTRYVVPVFAFLNAPEVYLHATVRICFENGMSLVCTKTCISQDYRRRRSIKNLEDASETITWGPIHIVRPETDDQGVGEATLKVANEEESISSEVKLIIVVAIGTACVLVLGVILGVLLKRSIQRKEFS
ncbi:unnamed protein product [Oikopleura dioica]|uniref:ZP domain-containing protein n=1 Tax=Oikopleura dioica TaxID=34765 RepID=E4WTZ3_OIKDI|nr:unnamed protein product [Oikopleura dioica]